MKMGGSSSFSECEYVCIKVIFLAMCEGVSKLNGIKYFWPTFMAAWIKSSVLEDVFFRI